MCDQFSFADERKAAERWVAGGEGRGGVGGPSANMVKEIYIDTEAVICTEE